MERADKHQVHEVGFVGADKAVAVEDLLKIISVFETSRVGASTK